MGDVTQDNIKALARVDPEVWFVLFAVLKDKEGKILPSGSRTSCKSGCSQPTGSAWRRGNRARFWV